MATHFRQSTVGLGKFHHEIPAGDQLGPMDWESIPQLLAGKFPLFDSVLSSTGSGSTPGIMLSRGRKARLGNAQLASGV